jgi:hypothetical protein
MKEEAENFDEVQQPQPQMQQPLLHFSLNVDEANLIFSALGELPHRVSDGLIRNMMQQAQAQIEKPN